MTPKALSEVYIRTVERENPRLTPFEVLSAALLSACEDMVGMTGTGFHRIVGTVEREY